MVIRAPRPRREPAVTETESIIRQDAAFCKAMRRAILMKLEHEPIPAIPEGEWKPIRYQVLTETFSYTSSSAGWLEGGER